jgi:hypothetical protein
MGMESRKHLRAAPPRDLELDRVLSEDETAEILGFSKHTCAGSSPLAERHRACG